MTRAGSPPSDHRSEAPNLATRSIGRAADEFANPTRLRGAKGVVWQLTAIDCYFSFAWAELVACASDNPNAKQTSKLARRVARELKQAGWRLEGVLCDNGNEFRGQPFQETIVALGARVKHVRSGRPADERPR
jgi:hypothetical protein